MAAKKKARAKRSKKTAQKKNTKTRSRSKGRRAATNPMLSALTPRKLFVTIRAGKPVGTPDLTYGDAKNNALPGDEIGTYALLENARTN